MNRLQKNRCQILWGLVAMLVLVGSLPAQPPTVAKRPRRVFIPIEDLGVVIDRDRRGVMLEKVEYNKLRTLAAKNERDRPRTPASLALREVVYTARPNGDRLSIDTSVRFQQFVRGWQSLRLPLRGVSVEKAVLEGRAARVARFQLTRKKVAVSGLELFHNTVGVATLELGLSTPLAAVGSDRVAAFGLVPAATASLIIHLPAGKHLLVDGLSVRRPAAADQPATYNLPVGGRSEIRLAVTDRQTQRVHANYAPPTAKASPPPVSPAPRSWRSPQRTLFEDTPTPSASSTTVTIDPTTQALLDQLKSSMAAQEALLKTFASQVGSADLAGAASTLRQLKLAFAGFSPPSRLSGANVSVTTSSISAWSMPAKYPICLDASAACSPAILPNTIRSDSELPPRRLAPCSPVATSPAAYSPGTDVS